jgi:ribosomal protein S19
MNRSFWKGNFSNLSLYLVRKKKFNIPIYVADRNSIILKKHINFYFKIYNGLKFIPKMIIDKLVDHKFGEFSLTTKMGSNIHKNKKLKKNKK